MKETTMGKAPKFYTTKQDSRGRYKYSLFNSQMEALCYAIDEDHIQAKLIKLTDGKITTPNALIRA